METPIRACQLGVGVGGQVTLSTGHVMCGILLLWLKSVNKPTQTSDWLTDTGQTGGGRGGGRQTALEQSFKENQLKFRGDWGRLRGVSVCWKRFAAFGGNLFIYFYFGGRFCEWFSLPTCQDHIFTLLQLKRKKGRQRHKQAQWGLGPTQRNDLGGICCPAGTQWHCLVTHKHPPKNLYSNISLQIQAYINL